MTPSTPSRDSARVRAMVLAVEFVPAPTISGILPPQRSTARRVSSSVSSSVSDGDSPVVPAITMPWVPSAR